MIRTYEWMDFEKVEKKVDSTIHSHRWCLHIYDFGWTAPLHILGFLYIVT